MEVATPFPMEDSPGRSCCFKALQQGSLIEAEQNWKLENEILDIHFFAYQVTGKIKLELDFNFFGLLFLCVKEI